MSCQSIEFVLNILKDLEHSVCLKDNKRILHILLENIPKAIDEISKARRKPELHCYLNKIKLCSCHLSKILPSLIKLLSAGSDPAIEEIIKYLVENLRWCFSEIFRIIQGGGIEEDSEPSGLFLKSVENFANFCMNGEKNDIAITMLIEDLLCHALTIAKIAEFEDYQEIAAACRNVLINSSGMSTMADIEKEPLAKDAIICSIAVLERKVNIAVLRLYLNVSSKFLPPLKNIVTKSGCHHCESSKLRQRSDIQYEINALDLYFERVQLIGNYAVACTDCKQKKLKVQCCLASLEFLANFLIPAAVSFYIDPTNLVKKRFLQFLTDESLDELKALTSHLDYNIVDTATFVQVFKDDVADVISKLKEKYHTGSYSSMDSNELTTKCYKIVNHLKATNDPLVKGNQNVTNSAKQLLNAIKEHGEQIGNLATLLNKRLFYSKLDNITSKIEKLLKILNENMLNFSQSSIQNGSNLSNHYTNKDQRRNFAFTRFPNVENGDSDGHSDNQTTILTSTPFAVCTKKINGSAFDSKLMYTPKTQRSNADSLDPYLNKIRETPLLRSVVQCKTPYKEAYIKKKNPKHLPFTISDAEESTALKLSFTDGNNSSVENS